MAIDSIGSEGEFTSILHKYVSASEPVKSIEHLRGRAEQAEAIYRALRSPGRSAFIYGDRGVGKTSLAQTSAYRFHTSGSEPIFLSMDASSTFFGFIRDAANEAASVRPDLISHKAKAAIKTGIKGLSAEYVREIQLGKIPTPLSMNEAVAMIDFFYPDDGISKAIVVDEFERLRESNERALFADFIKQVGDRGLAVKFIICGVGNSLDDLLSEHHSCFRYLETIKLERLDWVARNEIIESVVSSFEIEIDKVLKWRISSISDGYPYYVHIICEKLLWEVYDAEEVIQKIDDKLLKISINKAVSSIEPQLKSAYDSATKKYNSDYEEVLWAAADHKNLERRSSDIFESYERVMQIREEKELSRTKFNQRLNSLKKDTHGSILIGTRQGWYSFNENVVRGYVRLRAEQSGVSLDIYREED